MTTLQHDRINAARGLLALAARQDVKGQDTEVWYALIKARSVIDAAVDDIERRGMQQLIEGGPRD